MNRLDNIVLELRSGMRQTDDLRKFFDMRVNAAADVPPKRCLIGRKF